MTGDDIRKKLATNLKTLRQIKQISQEKLAEKANISLPYLSAIERSQKWPSPDTLAKLADSLDVKVENLLSDSLFPRQDNSRDFAAEVLKSLVEKQNNVLKEIFDLYFHANT